MVNFSHLKVHSTWSLARGASSIKDLIARSKDVGIPSFALTDVDNMYGALEFSTYAPSSGIQPIIACQFHLGDEDRKSLGTFQLYVKNEKGYLNICHLLRLAFEPYKVGGNLIEPIEPVITFEMLEKNREGLICLSGDVIYKQIAERKGYKNTLKNFLKIFGYDFYAEISRIGPVYESQAKIEDEIINLAMGDIGDIHCLDGYVCNAIPLVATTDIWYTEEDRDVAYRLLNAISNKEMIAVNNDGLTNDDHNRYHFRSYEDVKKIFSDLPDAVENAGEIAKKCHFHLSKRNPILPPFPCEEGRTEAEELREQSIEGLKKRILRLKNDKGEPLNEEEQKVYWERLDYELKTIEGMGFPGYFLIVSDFIKWAKGQDIPVGPGRGSGAGSIVAWALTITDLNPLEFGLLFERFLNPERVSMPDFDIDFCQDQREDVIAYVRERYGRDRVSMIGAFGQIKSKTALSDIQRVLVHEELGQIGFGEIKTLNKLIPKKPDSADPMGLKMAYDNAPLFREVIDEEPKMTMVYNYASQIEGLMRNASSHAAGIVIGDRPLDQLLPVTWDSKKHNPVTSFDMKGAEGVGLVKFDFLGLTTLSIIKLALTYINEGKPESEKIDINHIDRNDEKVFEEFTKANTIAVFQFESGGMQDVFKQIKPNRLEDLIAINALYRPGPMDFIPDYAQIKNGEKEADYPHPIEKTKPLLEETYGIMVYQEQVMQVAQACAGYSLGGADILRRAMGKKIHEEMVKQREIFINGDANANPPVPGAVKLGMTARLASEQFDKIMMFASYGFNKSHAAAYAWIGYQTMWLKVHYPAEFLSAQMTYMADSADSEEKLKVLHGELERLGIELLPPDVQYSNPKFKPEMHNGKMAVRFGLLGIKKISSDNCNFIEERKNNGPYKSLQDFFYRSGFRLNKAQLTNLAEAGAFDSILKNRRVANDTMLYMSKMKNIDTSAQISIKDMNALSEIEKTPDWGNYAEREFNAVGFYFSKHPIDYYKTFLKNSGVRRLQTWFKFMEDNEMSAYQGAKVCGIVTDVYMKTTQRGSRMLQVFVSEKDYSYSIVAFEESRNPDFLDHLKSIVDGAKASLRPMVFRLNIANGARGRSLVFNAVMDMDDYFDFKYSGLVIHYNKDVLIKNLYLPSQTGKDEREVKKRLQDGLEMTEEQKEKALDNLKSNISTLLFEASEKNKEKEGKDGASEVSLFDDSTGDEEEFEKKFRVNDKILEHLKYAGYNYEVFVDSGEYTYKPLS